MKSFSFWLKIVNGITAKYNKKSAEKKDDRHKTINMKQLIRRLHIAQPAKHVMAILGKK